MATIAVQKVAGSDSRQARVYLWETLTTTDRDGAGVEAPDHADRSVQAIGTFGAAAQIVIDGSNDGTNWAELNDPQGDPIAITAAGIVQIQEVTRYVRARLESGDGSTDVDVYLFLRAQP